MPFENWRQEINTYLIQTLEDKLPSHEFNEVIRYSVLPAGKLFRPLLVYSLAKDLGEINFNHKIFATSLELHHTYTLIHDDLPAMDDDDERRGRPSCHVKYNEWKAILAGDGLLNLSYGILGDMNSTQLPDLIRLYAEYMGPKGLILGQVKDLGHENKSLKDIIQIHELKTARLIQLAFLGCNLLSQSPLSTTICQQLGYALGVNFQLLDDLCELTEPLNTHEKEINPFLHFDQNELFSIIQKNTDLMRTVMKQHQLNCLKEYTNTYLQKMNKIISDGHQTIIKSVDKKYLTSINDLKI